MKMILDMRFLRAFTCVLFFLFFFGPLFSSCTQGEGGSRSVSSFQNVLGNSLVRGLLDETLLNTKYVNEWPLSSTVEGQVLQYRYSFNEELSSHILKLLKRYHSDYASVVVIDNETGKILTALGYEGRTKRVNKELAFSSTHPSASLFKIVTSAELLKRPDIDPKTSFSFSGRGSTLYKYQLKNKKNKWTRSQTLERAFAFSNNVIFGKAAIFNLSKDNLVETAEDFGFNRELLDEITLSQSQLISVEDNDLYALAEMASGFNDQTLMGPIHAAAVASVFANKGHFRNPYFVEEIVDFSTGKVLWRPQKKEKQILNQDIVKQMRQMMEATVKSGTAKDGFRGMKRKTRNRLYLGGKTGTITGGVPYGKRDWFTAYAIPQDEREGKGISVCVMNVNLEKWYVRSSLLAKDVIEYYFDKISPQFKDEEVKKARI